MAQWVCLRFFPGRVGVRRSPVGISTRTPTQHQATDRPGRRTPQHKTHQGRKTEKGTAAKRPCAKGGPNLPKPPPSPGARVCVNGVANLVSLAAITIAKRVIYRVGGLPALFVRPSVNRGPHSGTFAEPRPDPNRGYGWVEVDLFPTLWERAQTECGMRYLYPRLGSIKRVVWREDGFIATLVGPSGNQGPPPAI